MFWLYVLAMFWLYVWALYIGFMFLALTVDFMFWRCALAYVLTFRIGGFVFWLYVLALCLCLQQGQTKEKEHLIIYFYKK